MDTSLVLLHEVVVIRVKRVLMSILKNVMMVIFVQDVGINLIRLLEEIVIKQFLVIIIT